MPALDLHQKRAVGSHEHLEHGPAWSRKVRFESLCLLIVVPCPTNFEPHKLEEAFRTFTAAKLFLAISKLRQLLAWQIKVSSGRIFLQVSENIGELKGDAGAF